MDKYPVDPSELEKGDEVKLGDVTGTVERVRYTPSRDEYAVELENNLAVYTSPPQDHRTNTFEWAYVSEEKFLDVLEGEVEKGMSDAETLAQLAKEKAELVREGESKAVALDD